MTQTLKNTLLDRRAVVARLLKDRADDLLVVTGLGSPSYDVDAVGDHANNFYLWGAMGGAALVGFGLAQARPDRQVLVITGDGEQIMGLGGFATIAVTQPKNLTIVVLDNHHYGETGMQKSHTAHRLDMAQVARGCGIADAEVMDTMDAVNALADGLREPPMTGPRVRIVRIMAENLPRSLPPRDAVFVKNRFRAQLGLKTL